jgi:riboflavin synthase
MFTGIVSEVGKVSRIVKRGSLTTITVAAKNIVADTKVSDSIAVNGVCLTVVKKDNLSLVFEAVLPTIEKTNLKRLSQGDYVNLEPALNVGDKLGGHFVLGHVDIEAKLRRVINKQQFWQLEVELFSSLRKFIKENGSIAVEGISLTVKKIFPRYFTLDIIPFTYENTTLKYKKSGDYLNIEFDYLLKR